MDFETFIKTVYLRYTIKDYFMFSLHKSSSKKISGNFPECKIFFFDSILRFTRIFLNMKNIEWVIVSLKTFLIRRYYSLLHSDTFSSLLLSYSLD